MSVKPNRPKFSLYEMLEGMTPDMRRPELITGEVGRERIDPYVEIDWRAAEFNKRPVPQKVRLTPRKSK